MRILLIAQPYPPYPIVGALRARKVAEAFRAQGHDVVVVTERLEGEGNGLRVSEPGLQVHTVALGPQYRLRFLTLLNRLRGRRSTVRGGSRAADPGPELSIGMREDPRQSGFLRRLVLALLWLPDDEQRFIRPALHVARRLLPEVDLVYTTAPPFSTHLVGLLLVRRSPTRWVAEFRDPWTDQRDELPDRVGVIEAIHRWLERKCLRRADVVVAVTEGARRRLAEKLPESQRHKFVLALNGIDHLAESDERRAPGPFRIIYAGTFLSSRDPRPLLDAVANLCRRRQLGEADLRVDFVGRCREHDGASVERMVEQRGLEKVVRFHDWVPHEEAQAMLRQADLLFLIALGQPLQVPNKLFDYLGTRRTILALVDRDGESERMLRQAGGHFIAPLRDGERPEASALEAAIEACFDGVMAGNATVPASCDGEATLQGWLSIRQMERLVRAISA